jgi:hypothetical protein
LPWPRGETSARGERGGARGELAQRRLELGERRRVQRVARLRAIEAQDLDPVVQPLTDQGRHGGEVLSKPDAGPARGRHVASAGTRYD